MGKIGKAIGGAVGSKAGPVGAAAGAHVGSSIEDKLRGGGGGGGGGGGFFDAPKPDIPPVDPRIKQMVQQQQENATKFRESIPRIKQLKTNMADESSKQKLATDLSQTRYGASNRGLLYSGLRQGSEGQLRAKSASDLAAERASINQQVEDQARALDDQAILSGVGLQQAEMGRQDLLYSLARDQALAKAQLIGGAMGMLGQVGGKALSGGFG